MEFTGPAISAVSVEGRLTMANMAIEAGAKNGIFMPDDKTVEYLKGRTGRRYELETSDQDAEYHSVLEFDSSEIQPQVALPHLPENSRPVNEVKGVRIDQVIIGSCTNGRIEDMRVAAQILKGSKVARNVRCIVIPGTQAIYLQSIREGLVEALVEAGAVVSTPTCGPCLGGHMGVLAAGERAVSTNRNRRQDGYSRRYSSAGRCNGRLHRRRDSKSDSGIAMTMTGRAWKFGNNVDQMG